MSAYSPSEIIQTAQRLSYTVSGFNRYVRVNDYIVDTYLPAIVAVAYPRQPPNSFPIRRRANSINELLS